jgi:glycosyltransferase involved in cell wall biosynthesis
MIIGGPDKQRLYYQKMAAEKELTNIEFIGRIEHKRIPDYLYASDVLLAIWSEKVPTINYCSPLKVFEYMASGRIIVAHSFPTIKEVLTHGETALLADPYSADDLLKKLQKGLSLEYPSTIAEQARLLAFEKYSWTIRAKKILESISKQYF